MATDIFDPLEHDYDSTTQCLFRSAVEFSEFIELKASKANNSLVNTIIEYCEYSDVDYTDLSNLITPNLRDKIQIEMQDIGLMPKTSQLVF